MEQKKKVRLSDIAEQLNISTVTVSKALSNKDGVGDDLRKQIKDLAESMGYKIKKASGTTKNEDVTGNIGVLIPSRYFSPDFSYSTAFVETIGDIDVDEQISLLNKHKGAFRYRIGKSIRLRIVPDIVFKADNRFAVSNHINELLNTPQVRADVEKEIVDEEF